MNNLASIKVDGVDYQYIEYDDENEIRSTSVDGLIVPVNSTAKESLLHVGGFYRDLLKPLEEDEFNQIKRIVVLSATGEGMSQLTGFFFDDGDEDMKVSWTNEPRIANYYEKHVEKKKLSVELINTLEFLANLDNEESKKYLRVLDSYYNPVSPNDTGIVIDGEMVPYGSTLTINNFKTMTDKFENLKKSNLGRMNIDKIELKINDNGHSLMGSIGSGEMYDEKGELITVIKDYYYSYINTGEDENAISYEDFLVQNKIDELHGLAKTINRRLRGGRDKNEVIEEYVKQYEIDYEELNEPAPEMIGMNLLLNSIKEGLVTINK